VETKTGLNAFDLHYVGIRATHTGNLFRAVEWLERSLDRVRHGDKSIPEDLVQQHLEEILVQVSYSLHYNYNYNNYSFLCKKEINLLIMRLPICYIA